jgi:hypothetical protein
VFLILFGGGLLAVRLTVLFGLAVGRDFDFPNLAAEVLTDNAFFDVQMTKEGSLPSQKKSDYAEARRRFEGIVNQAHRLGEEMARKYRQGNPYMIVTGFLSATIRELLYELADVKESLDARRAVACCEGIVPLGSSGSLSASGFHRAPLQRVHAENVRDNAGKDATGRKPLPRRRPKK